MKTEKEIREQLDASEQELDILNRDAVMGKITFTESEGKRIESYIKALKWVLGE